mgnify:CR=1 FL=1
MSAKLKFKATIHHLTDPSGNVTVNIVGRDGWALLHLMVVGAKGLTTLGRPAPRWSGFVHKLRRAGLNITTEEEGHPGTFSGTHGRYRLQDRATVSGGNLAEWLASDEGRREFPRHSFMEREAA